MKAYKWQLGKEAVPFYLRQVVLGGCSFLFAAGRLRRPFLFICGRSSKEAVPLYLRQVDWFLISSVRLYR
jgi:hypothetical protein